MPTLSHILEAIINLTRSHDSCHACHQEQQRQLQTIINNQEKLMSLGTDTNELATKIAGDVHGLVGIVENLQASNVEVRKQLADAIAANDMTGVQAAHDTMVAADAEATAELAKLSPPPPPIDSSAPANASDGATGG